MQEVADMELLRRYVHRNSEAAFAALVTRHVNLVYSAALRKTGNAHAAEEITQAVFIILARKADRLRDGTILSGWLYQTARLTSASFLRTEFRRVHREQEASMQSFSNETTAKLWPEIEPLLEDAMGRLGEKDRNALVLRFFEGKSFQEIGTAVGASENAAKKRVAYALEKLRQFFLKRGVASMTTIIAGAISANSVQAAPVAMAKSVTAVAMAKGAAASGSTLILIKGALKVMAWTQAKTAAVAVAIVIVAIGTTTVVVKTIHPSVAKFTMEDLDAKIARLSHPGATVKEVLQVLGEPVKYHWNGKVFEKHHLPETYQLEYPQGVAVWVSGGRVQELRSEGRGRGFIWQGKLRLGSSLDEVLQVFGPPSSTVVGKPLGWLDGVLYKDIEGKKGSCYYSRLDQSIRLFFKDNKVVALYVVLQGDFGSGTPGEPIPDIDAKIVQLSRNGTTVDEVIRVLGKPTKYVWSNKTFKKDDLPKNYILVYSGNVNVWVHQGRVVELRSDGPGPGFTYRDRLRLGSSLEEALQVLGPPAETVVGKPLAFAAGVLYKGIEGQSGYGYYARPDQNVRLFFTDNKVTALYITLENGNR